MPWLLAARGTVCPPRAKAATAPHRLGTGRQPHGKPRSQGVVPAAAAAATTAVAALQPCGAQPPQAAGVHAAATAAAKCAHRVASDKLHDGLMRLWAWPKRTRRLPLWLGASAVCRVAPEAGAAQQQAEPDHLSLPEPVLLQPAPGSVLGAIAVCSATCLCMQGRPLVCRLCSAGPARQYQRCQDFSSIPTMLHQQQLQHSLLRCRCWSAAPRP